MLVMASTNKNDSATPSASSRKAKEACYSMVNVVAVIFTVPAIILVLGVGQLEVEVRHLIATRADDVCSFRP